MNGSFLKGATVGVVCAVVGGMTTLAFAGSGVGGVFNLGVSNTVTQQTSLSDSSTGAALKLSNTTGLGLSATSPSASQPALQAQNTGGHPAATFISNSGVAPFTVSNSIRIHNLNADLLDGLDSTALQKRVTGSCISGSAIASIAADGSAACTGYLSGSATGAGSNGVAGYNTCSDCTIGSPIVDNASAGHFDGDTTYGLYARSATTNGAVIENNTDSFFTLYAQADSAGGFPFEAENSHTGGYMYLDPNGNLFVSGTVTANGHVFGAAQRHTVPGRTPGRVAPSPSFFTGTAVTNAHGFARVKLPSSFQGRTPTYSLTGVGRTGWNARIGVWRPLSHGVFVIRSSRPHITVSWRVSAGQ